MNGVGGIRRILSAFSFYMNDALHIVGRQIILKINKYHHSPLAAAPARDCYTYVREPPTLVVPRTCPKGLVSRIVYRQ